MTATVFYVDDANFWRGWKKAARPYTSGAHPHTNDECPVRIGESERHGKGVFATRDVKQGEVLTYYPCDIVYTTIPAGKNPKELWHHGGLWTGRDCNRIRAEELIVSGEYTYTACEQFIGLPEKTDDPWFLGHMLNDAVCITANTPGPLSMKGIVYSVCAHAKNNGEFEEHVRGGRLYAVSIKASRDIKCGEEVTVSYGPTYWLAKHDKITNRELLVDTMKMLLQDM